MVEIKPADFSSRLDWGRVEVWAQQLARGDLTQIGAVFEANAAIPPRVRWHPLPDQLQTAQLRFLLDYWSSLKEGEDLPRIDRVDIEHGAPIKGYAALVDVVDDGRDFFYRRCSATQTALHGYDMTGTLVSELLMTSYAAESILALYRASYYRREPVYSERAPAGALLAWHTLTLPLADSAGRIARFLVGVVPLGPGGLPISPVP